MKKDFLKKASTDFALTIGATVVLVGTLQLLVYPFLAWKLDGDRYGLFLVAIGIVNALEPSFVLIAPFLLHRSTLHCYSAPWQTAT